MEEKRKNIKILYPHEKSPFLLIPPFYHLGGSDEELDEYLCIILHETGEEKHIPLFRRKRRELPKFQYLKDLFWESFRNFESLKEVLARGELEKIASMIETWVPERKGVGSIMYPRAGDAMGEFAKYMLLKKVSLIWK